MVPDITDHDPVPETRLPDPESLDPDPDPVKIWNPDFRSVQDPDLGSSPAANLKVEYLPE